MNTFEKRGCITATNWVGLIDLFFDLFVTISYQQKGDEIVYKLHNQLFLFIFFFSPTEPAPFVVVMQPLFSTVCLVVTLPLL